MRHGPKDVAKKFWSGVKMTKRHNHGNAWLNAIIMYAKKMSEKLRWAFGKSCQPAVILGSSLVFILYFYKYKQV